MPFGSYKCTLIHVGHDKAAEHEKHVNCEITLADEMMCIEQRLSWGNIWHTIMVEHNPEALPAHGATSSEGKLTV